jgi:hypothetical protein
MLPAMSPLKYSPVQQVRSIQPGAHFVQIYENNEALIDCLHAFLEKGFEIGEVALVIATRAHRSALEAKFTEAGHNVSELKQSGKYAPFDAAETLGLFMDEGRPEAFRFNALLGGLLKGTGQSGTGVRAFGEMVAILWDEGNRDGSIELEQLWNDLAKEHQFTLFCAYRQNQFATEADRAAFSSICNAHCSVIGSVAHHDSRNYSSAGVISR